jgi:hypothetical protein
MKGEVVVLSEFEIKIARYLGRSRHRFARNKNIVDAKIGNQSNEETDIESAAAEIAFCKLYNLYPDLQIGEVPTHDAMLPCGATVDVKQTKYQNGMLLVTTKKIANPSDIYVLLTGKMPEFTDRGGFPREWIFDNNRIVDLGHGPGYGIKQNDLWDVGNLAWRHQYGEIR